MNTQPHPFDVCMVCALPEEARALLDVLRPYCDGEIEEHGSPRYQYSYRTATIKNKQGEPLTLHISWLPRYGPTEMALHLSHVLEECQPRIAIMTGICAGDAEQVELGDLVVAERTFTYDSGKFTLDEHGRQVHLHDTQTYQLDAATLQFLLLFDDWKPLVATLPRPAAHPETSLQEREVQCHLKAMASGSAVRADSPFRDVRVPVRGTAAIDMEGAAFALAASRHHHTPWLVVKGVCDYADQHKNDAYHDYASRASAAYALSFLQAYVTNERLPQGLTVQVTPQLTITPQQRLRFIRSFQQEYGSRLTHSLQGRAAIELELHERSDMIASAAGLVFHHTDTATEYPLPPGTSIIQIYDQAQRGLLILGAPGSGKTTLLLDLVMELLRRAENDSDHPIPVILSLSSWAASKLAFSGWLSEQLSLIYGIPKRVGTPWIASDQIMFLLDGLDEMEDSARATCIETINSYRREHLASLVVCSRSWEYKNQQEQLNLPTAIEIQPLEPTRVAAYLKQAGKSLAAVYTTLRVNTTLQQLITTPLMLTIVLLTYRDKAVKDLPQMGSLEDQQRQIFAHYTEHMLERRAIGRPYTPHQIQHWLIWLAKQMQHHHLTEFYVELLQLTWLPTKRSQILFDVLSTMFFLGLAGALFCTLIGLLLNILTLALVGALSGALLGALFGKVSNGRLTIRPADRLKWTWKNAKPWLLVIGPAIGLAVGLVGTFIFKQPTGLIGGLVFALVATLGTGLIGGLSGKQINEDLRVKPNQGIWHSGRNALRIGLLATFVGSPGIGLVAGPIGGVVGGLAFGLLGSLVFGGSAYFQHYLLRFLFWRSGAMPWSYVRFLEDASACILLQRVGGGYRFIHPLFQEYFASLATSPTAP